MPRRYTNLVVIGLFNVHTVLLLYEISGEGTFGERIGRERLA